MWPAGFDPEHLTRDASLNKLVVAPTAGAQPGHFGKKGGELLGRDAISDLIRQRTGDAVPLDAVADSLVDAMAGDPRGAASAVVDEIGARIASLIATLRDPPTSDAASGGRRTYLEAWRTIDLVVLAGGLMKGVVGERAAARARTILGPDGPAVRAARQPRWLSLLGAGRSAPAVDGRVVVIDGGQSSIKRGVASVRDGRLAGVRVLPPVPVTSTSSAGLTGLVAAAIHELADTSTREVIFSVAAYVRDGRSIRDHASIYEGIDLGTIGFPVQLVHDGTAAWRGLGTHARSAVITLGTWLGVGIGPHTRPLLGYAEDFALTKIAEGG